MDTDVRGDAYEGLLEKNAEDAKSGAGQYFTIPPTNREIARALNIASTEHIDFHLTALEKKGWIARQPKKSRSIKITAPSQEVPVKGYISDTGDVFYNDPTTRKK